MFNFLIGLAIGNLMGASLLSLFYTARNEKRIDDRINILPYERWKN